MGDSLTVGEGVDVGVPIGENGWDGVLVAEGCGDGVALVVDDGVAVGL